MSSAKPTSSLRSTFGWVAAPFVLVALILYLGRADFHATTVEAPSSAPQLWIPVDTMSVTIPILQSNGRPARDAILIFSQPELRQAQIDSDGIATATLSRADRVVYLAYAPGFALFQGNAAVDADGQLDAVQLLPIHRPDFSGGEPLVKFTRTVRLRDEQERPLSALLVLARETGQPDSEPWVAISDLNGIATFPDATAADLHLDIYPAGFPPRLATRLGAIDVPADQGETPLRLNTARLEITNLPADSLFEWKRLDQTQLLPLHRTDQSRKLLLGPVAPGKYRIEIAGKQHDVMLPVGLTRFDFSTPSTPSTQTE